MPPVPVSLLPDALIRLSWAFSSNNQLNKGPADLLLGLEKRQTRSTGAYDRVTRTWHTSKYFDN